MHNHPASWLSPYYQSPALSHLTVNKILSIVLTTSRQCSRPTGWESASTWMLHCGRLVLWRSAWWGTILGGKERTARRLRYSLSIKKSLSVLAYLSEDLVINLRILRKTVMEWETLTFFFFFFFGIGRALFPKSLLDEILHSS